MNKKKMISFHACTPSQGVRTLSLSFANLLAKQNYSVLYVELDTILPSIAKSLQIETGNKNIVSYFEKTLEGKFDGINDFILSKEEILQQSDRKQKSVYSGLEDEVSYLIFPMELKPEEIPDLIGDTKIKNENVEEFVIDYVARLIETIRELEYDFILFKLANDVDHMFTYELMKHSDHVISVTTPSSTKIMDQIAIKKFLFEQNRTLEDKWNDVLNMASQDISASEYRTLLNREYVIPFDPERQAEELALQPDSPLIRQSLERMALDMGIQVNLSIQDEKVPFLQKVFGGRGGR